MKTLIFLLLAICNISLSYSAETSFDNRADKKFQFSLGYAAREYINTATSLNAAYFLKQDDLLSLSYTMVNASDNDAARKLRAVTFGYRKFFGNSFNLMPTIYWRRNTADYFKEGPYTFIGTNNLIYEDIGAGVRLGNEWQWEHIVFGCDWFGINHTIKELHKEEKGLGLIDIISLEKALTITVLKFYLGYSF